MGAVVSCYCTVGRCAHFKFWRGAPQESEEFDPIVYIRCLCWAGRAELRKLVLALPVRKNPHNSTVHDTYVRLRNQLTNAPLVIFGLTVTVNNSGDENRQAGEGVRRSVQNENTQRVQVQQRK